MPSAQRRRKLDARPIEKKVITKKRPRDHVGAAAGGFEASQQVRAGQGDAEQEQEQGKISEHEPRKPAQNVSDRHPASLILLDSVAPDGPQHQGQIPMKISMNTLTVVVVVSSQPGS